MPCVISKYQTVLSSSCDKHFYHSKLDNETALKLNAVADTLNVTHTRGTVPGNNVTVMCMLVGNYGKKGKIVSVKEWCDLENRVRVCSRSLEMAPLDRSHTSSYSPSSSARYSDLLVENREIFIPHLYLSPPQGILWRCLMLTKLEWLGYRTVKNLWQYVKPFSSNTGTLRTDRQTYGQNSYINIARQYADAR